MWRKEWQNRLLKVYSIEEKFLQQIQEMAGTGIGKWLGKRAIRSREERLSKVCGVSVELKVEWACGKEEVKKVGHTQVTGIWQNWGKNYLQTKHLFLYI